MAQGGFMGVDLKNKLKIIFVFFVIVVAYFYGVNRLPLLNRTDSRYAEIAREMVITGDYVIPKLMGTPHLHKPPLSYWLMALGMKIFGINEFGARFFQVLFAIFSLFLVYLIDKELFDKEKALFSLILTAISPAIFFTSRVLATDIFLLFFELLVFYSFLKLQKQKKQLWGYIFWLALGLGFLTKGPVVVVIPVLILFTTGVLNQDLSIFKSLFKARYLILFFLIAFPWYVYLVVSDKKVLKYFLIEQIYARVVGIKGTKIGHPKPFYYYFEILPVLILPFYIPFLMAVVKEIKSGISEREVFLIVWFALPLVFFSLILTKLPTYVLFSIPPAAMLTASWFIETDSTLKHLLLVAGFLPFLILLNHRFSSLSPMILKNMVWLVIWVCVLMVVLLLVTLINKAMFKSFFLFSWAIVYILIVNLFLHYPEILAPVKKLAVMTKPIENRDFYLISYKQYAFQLPFYTDKIPYYCNVRFEKGVYPFKRVVQCKALKEKWNNTNFLVLISGKDLMEFSRKIGDCFVLARNGNMFVISNKPLWGLRINWKEGVKTHNIKNLTYIFSVIKTSFQSARKKAYKMVDEDFLIHDEELAIIKGRLFYEFEFKKGERLKEIHIDTATGRVFPSLDSIVPEFSSEELKHFVNVEEDDAKKEAMEIIKGKVVEEELEIENGVLCHSFQIENANAVYEILINAANGLPFKISFEEKDSESP